ncbi:MAG TPA: glucoamylase family protein [Candidatus Limnocylindria bacterium]|nr:glucoamylase family protein [Candidatus Limnocylindria bacterium]
MTRIRHLLATPLAMALILSVAVPGAAIAADEDGLSAADQDTLREYASATWASFVAMTDEDTGLPADALGADGSRSVQTSTTNIGAYMWSALVAERLGFIDHDELVQRLSLTLETLAGMERNVGGQYFNWYDHRTGEKLTFWPPAPDDPFTPILSSVDNGWLATALHLVAESVPGEVGASAGALFDSMDFGVYYVPEANRIRFFIDPATGTGPCCYDTIVSESRISSYLGIAKGELPPKEYFGAWRTFPDTCDWNWQETRPVGTHRSYLGVSVFEGAYEYADGAYEGDAFRVVPGWGGSMFEALMPSLFVPEDQWGPRSWGVNHPLTVLAQIDHGLNVAQYGYWGFSPANIPEGGYDAWGVDAIGMNPGGYYSNEDHTLVDHGFAGCPGHDPQPDPPPEAYTNGVVTPHAAFLALRWAPGAVMANLANLAADFDGMYDAWGFHDSVNVGTGFVSPFYLALDQGMIMAAIGNALADDMMRHAFVTNEFRHALRPVIGMETFNAGPRERIDDLATIGQ